jgi:hypothetical protein
MVDSIDKSLDQSYQRVANTWSKCKCSCICDCQPMTLCSNSIF